MKDLSLYAGPSYWTQVDLPEAYKILGFEINSRFYEMVNPQLTDFELAERALDESVSTSNMIFAAGLDDDFGVGSEIKGVRGYNFASRFSAGSPIVRLAREKAKEALGFSRFERAYWLGDRGIDIYRESQADLNAEDRKKLMGYELARLRAVYYEPELFRNWLRFMADPDREVRRLAYDVISFELYLLEREKSFSLDSYGTWKIDQLAQEIGLKFGQALAREVEGELAELALASVHENMDGMGVESFDIMMIGLLASSPSGPLADQAREEIEKMSCGTLRSTLAIFWNNEIIKDMKIES
ncbi:MAG: hypothetical protein KDD43_11130, partial [Bdellovibrionales bacterium]|nr:hypothetical protein [Bdellovibrionales bacterium]